MTARLGLVRGYAVPWNVISNRIGEGPNAFREILDEGSLRWASTRPHLAREHGDLPFAKLDDGSLQIWSDSYGLAFEAQLDVSSVQGMAMGQIMARPRVAMSVNIDVIDSWLNTSGAIPIRNVGKANLREISVVDGPVYPGTFLWQSGTPVAEMPPRVAEAAARWERGRHGR